MTNEEETSNHKQSDKDDDGDNNNNNNERRNETNDNNSKQVPSSTQRKQRAAAAAISATVTLGAKRAGIVGAKRDGCDQISMQPQQPAPPITPLRTQQVRPARPKVRHQVMLAASEGIAHPLIRPIELTSLSAHPVPPKRPAHLPARYDTFARIVPAQLRPGPCGNGPSAAAAAASSKPNRYSSWADVQSNWRAAAVAPGAQVGPDGASYSSPHHQHHHHHFSSPFSSAASRVLVVNPMQIVNLSEHTKSRLIKIIEALKRFSEKWFSHVLLLMFLALYACFGAYIFINFEAPTEQWEKQMIIEFRQRMVNESWWEAKSKSQEEFGDIFRVKLEDYERLLNRACASGMTSSSLENQWTFWGALFYSMTVFTTIGYGHLTPITFAGRVATMIYAIFGIPILLMVLADLGKLLTRIIKYAFKRFCSLYNQLSHRKTSVRTRKMITDNTHHYIGAARGALERGYAHIQPYNKLPDALARASSFRKRFQRSTKATSQQMNPDEQQEASSPMVASDAPNEVVGEVATIQQQPQANTATTDTLGRHQLAYNSDLAEAKRSDLETDPRQVKSITPETMSDVIVTPIKQTKPVSPTVKDQRQSPFENYHGQSNHHHHSTSSSHHHHHHPVNHHHNRSQSPGRQVPAKRKSSLGGTVAVGGQKKTHVAGGSGAPMGSVSRSSSLSSSLVQPNVADSKNEKHPDAATKPTTPPVSADIGSANPAGEIVVDCDKARLDTLSDLDPTDTMGDNVAYEEEDLGEIEDEFDIPVSFALFLLVTYMMFGAVVFSIWEGWNFFDSLYFVFISMSTIGFGDLVPQHPKRMIGTFIYLLFGLALTSMCINVVQEKIHATFLRAKMQIGEKMGLDLDQIMADDYYDGSTMECDDDDLNSVTASQTNSSLACHIGAGLDNNGHGDGTIEPDGKPITVESHNTNSAGEGIKQSRSKDSIRSKRRTMAGLPAHNNTGSGPMLRRSHSKKLQRQMTPSSLHGAAVGVELASAINQPSPSAQQQPRTQPVAATVISTELGLESGKMIQSRTMVDAAPAINQTAGELDICGPVHRPVTNVALPGRTKLVLSNSSEAPTTVTKDSRIPKSLSSETGFEIGDGHSTSNAKHRPNTAMGHDHGPQSVAQGNRHRSAESSHRSSVSHELNELDDLLLKLSHCQLPNERFGPLLGIPAKGRRHSRPNSPNPHNNVNGNSSCSSSNNNNNYNNNNQLMPAKRGTSLINRPSRFQVATPAHGHPTSITSSASFSPGAPMKLAKTSGSFVVRNSPTGRLPVAAAKNSNDSSHKHAPSDDLEKIKFSAV